MTKTLTERKMTQENLLLDAKGNLKVIDFGMAALVPNINEVNLLRTKCGVKRVFFV